MERELKAYVGKRITLPVHYDLWMRGAGMGTVTGWYAPKGSSAYLSVRMDHPQVKRCVKLWDHDIPYARVEA